MLNEVGIEVWRAIEMVRQRDAYKQLAIELAKELELVCDRHDHASQVAELLNLDNDSYSDSESTGITGTIYGEEVVGGPGGISYPDSDD